MTPPNYVKIFVSLNIKCQPRAKKYLSSLSQQKNDSKGSHPQTMSKYLSLKYLSISKKSELELKLFKKLIFWLPFWGNYSGVAPKNFRRQTCISSSTASYKS